MGVELKLHASLTTYVEVSYSRSGRHGEEETNEPVGTSFQARSQNCEERLSASSCLSVSRFVLRSVHTENLDYHWTDFHEI
jgi:hypothetical protein